MASLKIRNLKIGEGLPKIAVPITGKREDEILNILRKIDFEKVDLVEWRADFFKDVLDIEKLLKVLKILRGKLGDTPLIFTFRTPGEGGEKDISKDDYIGLNKYIARSKLVDIIDIEIFYLGEKAKDLIKEIQNEGLFVIGSNHDFLKTPSEEDMLCKLKSIEKSGADILKMAVMPKTSGDVLKLLKLTDRMKSKTKKPLVTMSMGELGKISRISGQVFGSSISFGALDNLSAPGQIPVDELFNILNTMKIDN